MDYLDKLAKLTPVNREIYGYDKANRPNDPCLWQLDWAGRRMAWVETDAHFRERVKSLMGKRIID